MHVDCQFKVLQCTFMTLRSCFCRHTYSTTGENNELMNLEHHKKACRALKFSNDGIHLYTASKDKSIQVVDLNTGSIQQKIKGAHR